MPCIPLKFGIEYFNDGVGQYFVLYIDCLKFALCIPLCFTHVCNTKRVLVVCPSVLFQVMDRINMWHEVAACLIVCELRSKIFVETDRQTDTIYLYCKIVVATFNPLNAELNPICCLLALLGAHHFLHVSRIRVKSLTLRLLMSHIYGAPILDVSRSHTTTQHSR